MVYMEREAEGSNNRHRKLDMEEQAQGSNVHKSHRIRRWVACGPQLGSGSSCAQVLLALELDEGLLFAVKSCPCTSPRLLRLLNHELHLLQSLSGRSPFIIRCLGADYTTIHGTPFSRNLFLEYMESGSLAHVIEKFGGRLQAEAQVRWYTRAIVEGLTYLHQQGVVHCDIKGQNILVGSSGVKIADFGAAKSLFDADYAPQDAHFQGTPLWMAPEVLQGKEQSFPSDIWSLGCTVVEMIQGRPPWGHMADVAAALYQLACSDECPPLPKSISEDATDFLLHCLQREPKARWTAAQLLQHPFVLGIEAYAQPSPDSCVDILQYSDTTTYSDWGKESHRDTVPELPPVAAAPCTMPDQYQQQAAMVGARASPKRDLTPPESESSAEWLTVRKTPAARSCTPSTDKRVQPFTASAPLHVTRGCDVTFQDAAFLMRKRKAVVKLSSEEEH